MPQQFLELGRSYYSAIAPAAPVILLFVAVVVLLVALHSYRAQSLPLFAGIFSTQLFLILYVLSYLFKEQLSSEWLRPFYGNDFLTEWFWTIFSVHWLGLALFRTRLLAAEKEKSFLLQWMAYVVISFTLLLFLNFLEFYLGIFTVSPVIEFERIHLILNGLSGGTFLVALAFAVYRFSKGRQFVWIWTALAVVVLLGAIAVPVMAPAWSWLEMPLLWLSGLVALTGLLFDRNRYLQLESDLRKNLIARIAKLEDRAHRFETATSFIDEALVHLDLDNRIIFANRSFARLVGLPEEQNEGKSLKTIADKQVYEACHPAIQDARRSRTGHAESELFIEGKKKILLISYAPIFGDYHKLTGVHLRLRDITRDRTDAESLSDLVSEKAEDIRIYRQSVDHSNDAVIITDLEQQVEYVNEAFERMTGFSRQEIIGRDIRTYRDPKTYPWAEIKKRLDVHQSWRGRTTNCGKDGRTFVTELSVFPIADRNGDTNRFLWIEHDITARQELESQIQQQSESLRVKENKIAEVTRYYESLLNSVQDFVIVVDQDGVCTFANEYSKRRLGFSVDELSASDRLPGFFDEIQRLSGNYGEAMKFEFRDYFAPIKTRQGEVIPCVWNAHRLRRNGQENVGVVAIGHESSEQETPQPAEIAEELEKQIVEHTREYQRRNEQLQKLIKIAEDIRLNVGVETVMQSVASAIHTLGWQLVAVFRSEDGVVFDLVSTAGFESNQISIPRAFRKIELTAFSPYLLERFRISNSFFIDSSKLGIRPAFMPKTLATFDTGEWAQDDCLAIPIRSRESSTGMILAFCPEDGKRPGIEQIQEIEVFADDTAIAIENSRLFLLRQTSERQARLLAKIGESFDAAGTLESAVSAIAGIAAQAMHMVSLVAVQPHSSESAAPAGRQTSGDDDANWIIAAGFEPRKESGQSKLIIAERIPESMWRKLASQDMRARVSDLEIDRHELAAFVPRALKIADQPVYAAKLMRLRSRSQTFGFVMWIDHQGDAGWDDEQLSFAREFINKVTLTIDNTRLFHYTEEKAHELERANQLSSEFLANVSHELRTPLHSILQFSEILLSRAPGELNREQQEQIGIIQGSGKNLLHLINDILDLSKVEAGKMEASIESFDPEALIRRTVDTIRPLCSQKNLELRLDIASLPPAIASDRTILDRVLTNLASNAVKFTEQGSIEITARAKNSTLQIAVKDTGSGIPASRLDEIFEPFRQLESADSRAHSGTGLGLAISRRLLALLNGELTVKSRVGQGSTFVVTMPYKIEKRKSQKSRLTKGRQKSKRQQKSGSLFGKLKKKPKSSRKSRVLVVEDDSNTRYAMQYILESEGFEVAFADGGESALMTAQQARPNIILMDIMMPKLNGYQVARALKEHKQLAQIPVIALTAKAMKGDREKALAAGYDDYLTKPFDKADIVDMITKWLEQ